MSGPGRNDPCPCGSGKKFKRCCGAASGGVGVDYTETDRTSAVTKLARFSRREEFERDRETAEVFFWGPRTVEFAEVLSSPMVEINFHNFFTLDVAIDDGNTLLDLFLERHARSLLPGERRFLEDLRGSYVGIYEIVESRPGAGLRLRDLWVEKEEEVWVEERSASETLSPPDLLATRVVRRPSGEHVLEGDLYPIPAGFKDSLLAQLEQDRRTAEAGGRKPSTTAFMKRVSPRFHSSWLESTSPYSPHKLGTFDGELLELTVLRFAIESAPRLVRALDACEELQDEGDDGWVWLREVDGVHHLVGELRIDASELVVTTLARAHGKEARALLERIAGDALCHVGTEYLDADESKEHLARRQNDPGADPHLAEPAPAETVAVLNRVLDNHYRRWLDDEIPALGGNTPRAAAADDRLRPRLVELLKGIEEEEERRPSGATGPYDYSWLWRELGLGRAAATGDALYPQLIADLRHYLDGDDLSDLVPREPRNIGLYLGRIAAAASQSAAEGETDTGIECRRRPSNRPCRGSLLVWREPSERLVWGCPSCGDGGTIEGWRGTAFDLSSRDPGPEAVVLESEDLRRLLRLAHLTAPALTLLVSARVREGHALLEGNHEELESLLICIVLELGSQRVTHRAAEKLDHLHAHLSRVLGREPDLSLVTIGAEIVLREAARRSPLRKLPAAGAPDGGHRLHVRLLDIEPPIWRRLELPSRTPLEDLHPILVLAMGWTDSHLHLFEHEGHRYAPPHPDDELGTEDSRAVLLGELLPREGDRLVYEYDFGDSWRHEIRVESITPSRPARPRLVDGARACPPEDCGGQPGHERLLAALADPFDPEHESYREWAGESFDPELLDLRRHDHRLERLAAAWGASKPRTPQRT